MASGLPRMTLPSASRRRFSVAAGSVAPLAAALLDAGGGAEDTAGRRFASVT